MADVWAEYEVLAGRDRSSLSPGERRFVAFGALRAELNNGGFHQYFSNSAGDLVDEALAAASAADFPELAALLQRALTLLGLRDSSDRDARQDRLDALDDDVFAALDAEYLALEASTDLDEVFSRVRGG